MGKIVWVNSPEDLKKALASGEDKMMMVPGTYEAPTLDPENKFVNLVGWVKGCEPKVRLHFNQEESLEEQRGEYGTGDYRPWKAISTGGWTSWHRTPAEALKEIFVEPKSGPVDIVLADGTMVFTVMMP